MSCYQNHSKAHLHKWETLTWWSSKRTNGSETRIYPLWLWKEGMEPYQRLPRSLGRRDFRNFIWQPPMAIRRAIIDRFYASSSLANHFTSAMLKQTFPFVSLSIKPWLWSKVTKSKNLGFSWFQSNPFLFKFLVIQKIVHSTSSATFFTSSPFAWWSRIIQRI